MMIKKIFTDHLPKVEEGLGRRGIDWKNSMGNKIDFIYKDIKGHFEIVDYISDKKLLKIKYNNNLEDIYTSNLIACKIGAIVGKFNKSFYYSIGEVIGDLNNGKLQILEQLRWGDKNVKAYKYLCLICNNLDTISEGNLTGRRGCNVCSGKKVLIGFNDIWTVNPQLAALLKNPEDGYKYTIGSGKRLNFKCDKCQTVIKNKMIRDVSEYGLSCPQCSDGISYPEKFMFNVLIQLGVAFDVQKTFTWSDGKRYDFYLIDHMSIVETHGEQHYKGNFYSLSGKRLEEEQKNDRIKRETALKNKIKRYIEIDTKHSDLEYIKKSILNSELTQILDLSPVDWLKCHEYACSSLVKLACDLWNSGMGSTQKIANEMQLNRSTIRQYLKKGVKLKWCDYSTQEVKKASIQKTWKINKKEVIKLDKNTLEFLDEYESINQASEKTGILSSNISFACKNNNRTSGGYKWMFKKDWLKLQANN
jgi:hypothetical protein